MMSRHCKAAMDTCATKISIRAFTNTIHDLWTLGNYIIVDMSASKHEHCVP